MKYCEDYAALLDLYVDGELSPEDTDRVRAHLETCPGCRAYVDDALAIRAAFPDAEDTEVPAGFAGGVMAAVRAAAQEKPAAPQAKKRHWGRVLLPLAACCAIVILLHGVTGSKNSPVEYATASSAADTAATTESMEESIAETEEAAAEAPAEAAANGIAESGGTPETRVAFTTSDAGTGASVNDQASSKALPETGVVEAPAGAAVPEAQAAEPEEADIETASSVSAFATLRLTTAQAGDLLAEHSPVSDADGVLCYELSQEDYDALLAALADDGVTPEPDEEDPAYGGAVSDSFALVYVAEEWPEDAD